MGESDSEVSISRRLHALLKASSTVAMLTARPLGIKPPPVLEVGNDKSKVSPVLNHATSNAWHFSQPLRRSSVHKMKRGDHRATDQQQQLQSPACATDANGAASSGGSFADGAKNHDGRSSGPHNLLPTGSLRVLDLHSISSARTNMAKARAVVAAFPGGKFAPMTEDEVALCFLERYRMRRKLVDPSQQHRDLM
ncbi:unnamed protein product [Sphacelaria rigidula]